jgi:uncharacterized membrane protein
MATAVALSAAGFAVSAYLTVEHFTASATLACPAAGVLDCRTVTNSPQSTLLGVPLPILGLAYSGAMLALSLPRAPVWRSVRVAGAGAGALFVLYLVSVELFVVDALCLWCTAVHAVTIALFAVVVWGTATAPASRPPERWSVASSKHRRTVRESDQ